MRGKSLFASIAAGLALSLAAGAATAQTNTVRVGNLEIAPFLPVAYAARLGKQHDLDVRVTNFRRGLEAAQALRSGDVDVAVGGIEAAIAAIGGGAPAVIISSTATGAIQWVARPDVDIKTIADLKGKKFAVIRGLHELVMLVLFEKHGISSSTEPGKADVQLLFISSPPALIAAMKGKEVDAMSAPEPFPSRAIQEGYARPFLLPYDSPLGKLPRAVFMRKDFLDKNPAVAQRYVDSLVEGTKKLRDDPKFARDFALNDALKGAMSGEDWDLGAKNVAFDVSLDPKEIQAYIDYMRKYKMLKGPEFKASDAASLGMLEKSKAKYRW